jgi:hypothetical protein
VNSLLHRRSSATTNIGFVFLASGQNSTTHSNESAITSSPSTNLTVISKSTTDRLGLKLSQTTRTLISLVSCRPHFPGALRSRGPEKTLSSQLFDNLEKWARVSPQYPLVIVGPIWDCLNVAVSLLEEISGLLNAHFQVYNHDSSS